VMHRAIVPSCEIVVKALGKVSSRENSILSWHGDLQNMTAYVADDAFPFI